MPASEEYIRSWHMAATNNEKRIRQAGGGRCGFCFARLRVDEIIFMKDGDHTTAVCPECQVDCVIPNEFVFTSEKLKAFKKVWFEENGEG